MAKHTKLDRAIDYPYHMIEEFHERKHTKRARTLGRRQQRELRANERESENFSQMAMFKITSI